MFKFVAVGLMTIISLVLLTLSQTVLASRGDERDLEAVSADAEACTEGLCPKNTVMSNRDKMSEKEVIELANIIFDDAFKNKPLPELPNSKTSK